MDATQLLINHTKAVLRDKGTGMPVDDAVEQSYKNIKFMVGIFGIPEAIVEKLAVRSIVTKEIKAWLKAGAPN